MQTRRYQGIEYIQGAEVPVFYIPSGKPPRRWETFSLVTVSPSGLAFYQGIRTLGKHHIPTTKIVKIITTLRSREAMLHEQGWRIFLPLHRYYHQHTPELYRAFPHLEPLLRHWYQILYTHMEMPTSEWEKLLDDVKYWWQTLTTYWMEKEDKLKNRLHKLDVLLAKDFTLFDLTSRSSLPTLQQRYLALSRQHRKAKEVGHLEAVDRAYGRLLRRLQEKNDLTLQGKKLRKELSRIRQSQKNLQLDLAE
jgi:hypothetical protein